MEMEPITRQNIFGNIVSERAVQECCLFEKELDARKQTDPLFVKLEDSLFPYINRKIDKNIKQNIIFSFIDEEYQRKKDEILKKGDNGEIAKEKAKRDIEKLEEARLSDRELARGGFVDGEFKLYDQAKEIAQKVFGIKSGEVDKARRTYAEVVEGNVFQQEHIFDNSKDKENGERTYIDKLTDQNKRKFKDIINKFKQGEIDKAVFLGTANFHFWAIALVKEPQSNDILMLYDDSLCWKREPVKEVKKLFKENGINLKSKMPEYSEQIDGHSCGVRGLVNFTFYVLNSWDNIMELNKKGLIFADKLPRDLKTYINSMGINARTFTESNPSFAEKLNAFDKTLQSRIESTSKSSAKDANEKDTAEMESVLNAARKHDAQMFRQLILSGADIYSNESINRIQSVLGKDENRQNEGYFYYRSYEGNPWDRAKAWFNTTIIPIRNAVLAKDMYLMASELEGEDCKQLDRVLNTLTSYAKKSQLDISGKSLVTGEYIARRPENVLRLCNIFDIEIDKEEKSKILEYMLTFWVDADTFENTVKKLKISNEEINSLFIEALNRGRYLYLKGLKNLGANVKSIRENPFEKGERLLKAEDFKMIAESFCENENFTKWIDDELKKQVRMGRFDGEKICSLIEFGAKIQDDSGWLLKEACKAGRVDVVEVLLNKGIELNGVLDINNPLLNVERKDIEKSIEIFKAHPCFDNWLSVKLSQELDKQPKKIDMTTVNLVLNAMKECSGKSEGFVEDNLSTKQVQNIVLAAFYKSFSQNTEQKEQIAVSNIMNAYFGADSLPKEYEKALVALPQRVAESDSYELAEKLKKMLIGYFKISEKEVVINRKQNSMHNRANNDILDYVNGANNKRNFYNIIQMLQKSQNLENDELKNLVFDILSDNWTNVEGSFNEEHTLLQLAVRIDDLDIVNRLLQKGAEIDKANEYGKTPLILAVLDNRIDILKLLLDKGADVNKADNSGMTPLLHAAREGRSECVELLLEKCADVDRADNYRDTPLNSAIWEVVVEKRSIFKDSENHKKRIRAYEDIIEQLIKKGADIHKEDRNGNTSLSLASRSDNPNIMKLLLDYVVDVNAITSSGKTLLAESAARGSAEVINILLEKGGDINKPDSKGVTPFQEAIANRNAEAAILLLEKGACIKDENVSKLLCYAVLLGKKDAMKVLIEKGADVNIKCDKAQYTNELYFEGETYYHMPLLKLAVDTGRTDVAEILIQNGAKVNDCDFNGILTELCMRLANGVTKHFDYNMPELLIEYGLKEAPRKSILDSLERFYHCKGYEETVYLLSHMDEIFIKNCEQVVKNGELIKFQAILRNRDDVLKKNGAHFLRLAAENGNKGIVEELISKGVRLGLLDKCSPEGKKLIHDVKKSVEASKGKRHIMHF